MFSQLIEDLIAGGLTESDIGRAIGRSQATVNRVRNGRQELAGWEAVDKLRALHRSRCAQPTANPDADLRAEVARVVAMESRGEREFHLLRLPSELRGAVEAELVLHLASRMQEGTESGDILPAWLEDRVLEKAGVRPEKRAANA